MSFSAAFICFSVSILCRILEPLQQDVQNVYFLIEINMVTSTGKDWFKMDENSKYLRHGFGRQFQSRRCFCLSCIMEEFWVLLASSCHPEEEARDARVDFPGPVFSCANWMAAVSRSARHMLLTRLPLSSRWIASICASRGFKLILRSYLFLASAFLP